MKHNSHGSKSFKNLLFYIVLFTVLLLLTAAITIPYISSQHAFLGGDINAGFYNRTIDITHLFQDSPAAAVQKVFQEANKTYNSFYTLPLIPFILILGGSYLAYVISVAIVYLLPLNFVLGAIATRLIPGRPKAVFASTVIIAALMAPNWVTVFIGHPDIGATLIVALAILVSLHESDRTFTWLLPNRWQIPTLGFLLGTAILFRRHYAYADIAILGAILIHAGLVFGHELRQNSGKAWRNGLSFSIRLSLVIATSLVTLAVFAPEFTYRALTTNYVSLYDSWSRPVGEAVAFYSSLYGWGIWGVALVGFIAGAFMRVISLPVATFLVGFGGISIAIWLFKLRYTETYYAIHFVPFIILGIVAFVWVAWRRTTGSRKAVLLGLFGLYFSFNAIACLTPLGAFQHPLRPLFAANYPPPVRKNYDEIVQLTTFLRQLAPNQEAIFIVPTGHLSEHLISAAEQSIYGNDGSILKLRHGSVIDSVGYYSIRELLEADYIVIAQPFLSWHEGQQETAKVVFDAFTQDWEITEDFEPLPIDFDLQDGVIAKIYQRIQPTSIDRAVRTLHAMKTQINKPLGQQLDWINLSHPFKSKIKKVEEMKYNIDVANSLSSSTQKPIKSFLYLGKLTQQVSITGRAVLRGPACQNAALSFAMLDEQGHVVSEPHTVSVSQATPFKLSLQGSGSAYILLEASNPAFKAEPTSNRCSLKIRNLVVSSH